MTSSLNNLKEKIGVLTKFVLDNMNKPVTSITQAEFNVVYHDYNLALDQAKKDGITENVVVSMKQSVEVPEVVYQKFDDWFCDRFISMTRSGFGDKSNSN